MVQNGVFARDLVAQALRELIDRVGENRATEIVGVSRPTMGRLAGSMSVKPATLFMAAQRLRVNLAGAIADDAEAEGEIINE